MRRAQESGGERRGRAALRGAAVGAALLSLVACLSSHPSARAPTAAAYEQEWAASDEVLRFARSPEAYHARLALVQSPAFDRLASGVRHDRLLSTALLGIDVKDFAGAHRLLKRSSTMPGQLMQDWRGRFAAAFDSGDKDDATLALVHLAQTWPAEIPKYPVEAVAGLAIRGSDSGQQRDARFELRSALYRASYRENHGASPGTLWGLLAMDLVDRGRTAEALEVIPQVNSPRMIVTMRIDRRFDDLVRRAPQLFDVRAVAERHIRELEEVTRRLPRRIDPLVQLCYAYLDAGRYQEALRTASGVLSRADDPRGFRGAYDEDETALNWMLDTYARALKATQHWQEAASVLELAAQGLEHGRLNVSNVINLGDFYADLGQGDRALRVLDEIADVDSNELVSAVGRMQWYAVQLRAALARNDASLARASLAYLATHQADAPDTYGEALLQSGRLDEAARLLIARLRDPHHYREALRDVQTYDDPPSLPAIEQQRARWRELLGRRDVQQAIARVGHIESVPLPRKAYF